MPLNKLSTNRKAALELSIGTIVVIVIAMSMLILGLILVKTIFTGAKYNVDQLNKNVEAEINKLFDEKGGKTFVYLPDSTAEVKKGDSFGIAFSVKNDVKGESSAGRFSYNILASEVSQNCRLTISQADGFIYLGKTDSFDILPGQQLNQPRIIRVQVPESAPLCEIRYNIVVTKDNQPYDTNFFIAKII